MIVTPPPTDRELADLKVAIKNNIDRIEYINNQVWYENWFQYLIGLRRAYQVRFLAEAYNDNSSST